MQVLRLLLQHYNARTTPSGTVGVPVRLTLTAVAITRTGIMLLFTCPSTKDERKMRDGDWLPLLPAAFIRDDMQGLIISSSTESQL